MSDSPWEPRAMSIYEQQLDKNGANFVALDRAGNHLGYRYQLVGADVDDVSDGHPLGLDIYRGLVAAVASGVGAAREAADDAVG